MARTSSGGTHPSARRGGDKGGSKKPKTRGFRLDQRIDEAIRLMSYGWASLRITEELCRKYSVAERTAKEYMHRANAQLEEENRVTRKLARKRQRLRLMRTIQRAEERRAFNAVLGAEAILVKLEGTAYEPADDLDGDEDSTWDVDPPPDDEDDDGEAA